MKEEMNMELLRAGYYNFGLANSFSLQLDFNQLKNDSRRKIIRNLDQDLMSRNEARLKRAELEKIVIKGN